MLQNEFPVIVKEGLAVCNGSRALCRLTAASPKICPDAVPRPTLGNSLTLLAVVEDLSW